VSLQGVFYANYVVVMGAATVTATAGSSYFCDSTGGDITINLPSAPSVGDSPINVTQIGGNLSTGQLLTISSGSLFIMGTTQNTLSVDVANASMSLMYAGPNYGWRLRTMG
jgi:hypothetical protein